MNKGAYITDIHCHTAGAGYGGSGCFVSPRLRKSWKYGVYLRAFGITQAELERYGDAAVLGRLSLRLANSAHVKRAVVLAMDGVVGADGNLDRSRTEVYIPDEFLAKTLKGLPNLLFGASVNPYRKDALERLARAKEEGAVLIKWLPSVMGIDPAGRAVLPFYRELARLGLPLLSHTGGEHSFTRADDRLADPERLRLALDEGVTVIAAHVAATGSTDGVSNTDRLAAMFPRYDNLYADISSLTQINRLAVLPRLLRREEYTGRLIYGTDMPLVNTALVSAAYYPHRISISKMIDISREPNPWDRDVLLKKELGVPDSIFTNAGVLLGIGAEVHND